MPARPQPKTSCPEHPSLLLEVTADAVIEELEAWLGKQLPQRRRWITRLTEHARAVMTANARFRRRINSAPTVEPLVVYLRHWLAEGLGQEHPALYSRLPARYAMGVAPTSIPPRTARPQPRTSRSTRKSRPAMAT